MEAFASDKQESVYMAFRDGGWDYSHKEGSVIVLELNQVLSESSYRIAELRIDADGAIVGKVNQK